MSDRDFNEALTLLLPPGPAWNRSRGSVEDAMIRAVAKRLQNLDALSNALFLEFDPRSASFLFQDWLRCYGLPDECLKAAENLTESQLRKVLYVLVFRSALTHDFYKQLGLALDVDINAGSVDQFSVDSCVDDALYDDQWSHAFVIVVSTDMQNTRAYFDMNSSVDEPLSTWGVDFLRCLIRKNIPAHAEVVFQYK